MIYTADNYCKSTVYELVWDYGIPTLRPCKRSIYSVDTDDNSIEYYADDAVDAVLLRKKVKTLKVLELPESSFIFIVEFL